MLKRNAYLAWIISVPLFLLTLLIVGSFLDLKIAQSIYNDNNIFSKFFEVIAKMPALFIGGFCCIIMFFSAKANQTNIHLKRFLCIVYAFVGICLCSYAFLDATDLFLDKKLYSIIVAGVCGVAVFALMLFITIKKRMQEFDRYKKWAIYFLITLVSVIVVTFIFKLIWGRARFFDVVNDTAVFSEWFLLNRVGGSSMPSGHTAVACCLFLVLPLTKINEKWNEYAYWIRLVSSVFVVFTMLSRLCGGYHYLSDIAMSGIIVYVAIMVNQVLFFGKKGDKLTLSENSFWNKI